MFTSDDGKITGLLGRSMTADMRVVGEVGVPPLELVGEVTVSTGEAVVANDDDDDDTVEGEANCFALSFLPFSSG